MNGATNLEPGLLEDAKDRPVCELILVNGRLAGTRRSLTEPLTLVGRAAGCDIRLNVDGVRALHCGIILGREAVTIRDFGGEGVTRVNGEPVLVHTFRHGDLVGVGPFQFRVELHPLEMSRQLESLRVQAAAVAAQQASLTEQEIDLHERGQGLTKQERQLAVYLEERCREIDAQNQELERERQAAATDRAALDAERDTIAQEKALAVAERARLAGLRARFKKSWGQKWRAREHELAGRSQDLALDRRRHEEEQAALHECRLRFNGEAELRRRQLEHGWEELAANQRLWEEGHRREEAALEQSRAALETRAAELVTAEQWLKREHEQWVRARAALVRENDGLESRVGNLRARLLELEYDRAALCLIEPVETVAAAQVPPPLPGRASLDGPVAPRVLMGLAGDLADQRRRLLEHWEQLLRWHLTWMEERRQLLRELETSGQQVQEAAEDLEAQRRALGAAQIAVRQQQDSLAEQRGRLDAWQAELTLHEASWEAECAHVLGDAARRVQAAERRWQELKQLCDKWSASRSHDLGQLRTARMRQIALRRQYARLLHDCEEEKASLVRKQRKLATRLLAFERWRQELLLRSRNAPAADKRLERLADREEGLWAEAEAESARRAEELRHERERLEQRALDLDRDEADVTDREQELGRQLGECELRQAALVEEERRREAELVHWQRRQEQDQREIARLRDEIERIVLALLEGAVPPAPSAIQAA